jgi:hypothetical protein
VEVSEVAVVAAGKQWVVGTLRRARRLREGGRKARSDGAWLEEEG